MKKTFARDFDSLDGIFAFVSRFLSEKRIDEGVAFSINLAVEELFTNMVKYNTGTSRDIAIGIASGDNAVTLQIVDFDVDPFDPDSVAEVTVDEPVESRTPGGLGLHLVKSVVDRVTYEYKDRRMKVTVTKYLER